MKSYFFVPGTKLDKIEKIKALGVSEIIIDIEDAVKFSEREKIISNLNENKESLKKHYIRLPLTNSKEELDLSYLYSLMGLGFRRFIFPKLQGVNQINSILPQLKTDVTFIILVENPRLLLELPSQIINYNKHLVGVGLGSHDFMSEIGGEHILENLNVPRQNILYLARMSNILSIDIASMELKNENEFKNEIIDGFKKGYDAKFYIHPWQLNILKEIKLYTKKEYTWAKKIGEAFEKSGNKDEFSPIIVDGQIIERPHLKKQQKIIEYFKTNES